MSASRTLRRLRARRSTEQSGFTLIEVLLVVGITGLLVGPLLAWMVLVMRQQPVEQDGMLRTAQASMLRQYFPQDVANAGGADDYSGPVVDARWENWRQECIGGGGEDGRRLAVLISQDDELVKTIYSVAPNQDDPDKMALWRDRCTAARGELIETSQIVEQVDDDGTRTVASCFSADRNGVPDAPCRQVNLRVAIPGAADLVQLSATRRADARSLDRDPTTGNILPVALIDILSYERIDNGSLRVRVELSGASSYDDGSIVSYRWELPTAPQPNPAYIVDESVEPNRTIELNEVGTFTARLTVTDDEGGTDTTYRRIAVVENRRPTAVAAVGPDPVIAGQQLNLDGTGSTDLDGSIDTYLWRLRSDLPDLEDLDEFVVELEGASTTWTVPEWAFGPLVVELIVTDDRGAVGARSTVVQIQDPLPAPGDEDVDPNEPEPTDPGEPDPEPVPGAPVAAFTATVGTGNSVSFDASETSGSIVSYAWNFGLLAGVGNGGPVISHLYPAPGTYTARLTVTDDQGRTGTRAALVVIPGGPQAPTNVRVQNNVLLWNPRPGARRYLVDLESVGPGCARSVTGLATAASAEPRRALPPNPCTGESTVRARVGTENAAGGPVAWSGWIDVPTTVVK